MDVYGTRARLHYDVTGSALPHALPGLLTIASAERLLYASDTPFTPPNLIQADARALVETDVLDDSQRHELLTDNAEQLSPGWLAR
ncbi:MAG TPA: amidohydrolase family protein [Solirubrobacterales bacterium]